MARWTPWPGECRRCSRFPGLRLPHLPALLLKGPPADGLRAGYGPELDLAERQSSTVGGLKFPGQPGQVAGVHAMEGAIMRPDGRTLGAC